MPYPLDTAGRAFALVCAPCIAAVVAQQPPCLALNDTNPTVTAGQTSFDFGGQNFRAWRLSPTQTMVVEAVQVFTRNNSLAGSRFMTVELWSDAGGLPAARLASGSWRIQNSRPLGWQGANLDHAVVLAAGTPVWVAWVEPGLSTPPEEPGGVALPTATRVGAGAWLPAGVPTAPKLRLYCSLLADANSVPVGVGCPQSTGRTASVFTNEPPLLGSAVFAFESSGNPVGGTVFLVFGLIGTYVPAPVPGFPVGCLQNTDVVTSIVLTAGVGTTRGPTCSGYAAQAFPLPPDASLVGYTIAAQAASFDPGALAPLPFATSNAQRVTLQ
jgi:hypothetical protein